jgi:hypothetical protein
MERMQGLDVVETGRAEHRLGVGGPVAASARRAASTRLEDAEVAGDEELPDGRVEEPGQGASSRLDHVQVLAVEGSRQALLEEIEIQVG